MARPSGGVNKAAVQWALFVALGVIAIAYYVMPIRAQDRPSWAAELWSTERGEELVAVVYSEPPVDEAITPALVVMCGGSYWLRYDPGPGGDPSVDWEGQAATFAFDFGRETVEHELQFEAMDAMFAAELAGGDPLIRAIQGSSEVTVSLADGTSLPANSFSLAGSSAALGEVRRAC